MSIGPHPQMTEAMEHLQKFTRLHIEDGLLRLGAETVEQRINEALRIAQSEVDLALEAQQEHLVHKLNEIAGSLTKLLEQ